MKSSGIITLTTDFGSADPYVSIMKGVILSINPEATLIDITHEIEPGGIAQAAAIIEESHSYFPYGTIHLGVVDPGVGGNRRPVVFATEGFFFVGPDNGIFWPVIKDSGRVAGVFLTEKDYFRKEISATFHGRDIFAPAAAHLSRGVDPLKMGQSISDPVKLEIPGPVEKGDSLSGIVTRVDRFGNLITNIHHDDLKRFLGNDGPVIKIGQMEMEGLGKTYSEVGEGEILALVGSSGFLEISESMGRACDRIIPDKEVKAGIKVKVTRNERS
jgi:hypothetical protein